MFTSVRDATNIRGIVPKAFAASADRFYNYAINKESSNLELIIAESVVEQLTEIYPEEIDNAIEEARTDLFYGKIAIDYGLWISDSECVGVVIYSDTGIQGIITNNTKSSIMWANKMYESTKKEAEEVISTDAIQD
jgi:predicted transcriptional regulator